MNSRTPNEYSNGVIDIFKLHKVYEFNTQNCLKKGDVTTEMDKDIGRRIIKLFGCLSPSNNITVPNPKYQKYFAYTGKNFYIFFKAYKEHKFSFQLTFSYSSKDTVRFLFKYPCKKLKISRTNAYNIEIPIEINDDKDNNWILYKFRPVEYINKFLLQYKEFSALTSVTVEKLIFKSFEIYSTVIFHGIFITNIDYQLNNLPKEMSVKCSNNRPLALIYLVDVCEQKEIASNDESITYTSKHSYNLSKSILKKSCQQEDAKDSNINNINKINLNENNFYYNTYGFSNMNLNNISSQRLLTQGKTEKSMSTSKNYKNNTTGSSSTYRNNSQICKKVPLEPDPIINLNFIIGYTSQICPNVIYNSNGDYNTNLDIYKETSVNPTKKHMYFCSGPNIIKFDQYNMTQKFFIGHSKPISHFIVGCKGEIIFSGQEGINSIIRVWRTSDQTCIKLLTTPLDKLKSLSESKTSKLLCASGIEQLKELFLIWSIQNLNDIKILIRQNVSTPINTLKFVPYDEEVIISCGNENIKFWRIKNNKILGKAVVLSQYAKNNNFLCIDFNKTIFGDDYLDKGKAYVGSSGGCVFQIACNSQELDAVYRIHDSQILSLSVNEVFCATGSSDGYLRLWPIDFKEFLMEAKHDDGICSVDLSYDSLEVLAGTFGGSIGILDIKTKGYKTILRSPPSDIKQLIIHPSNNFVLTIETQGTVRIWDIQHKSEAFQYISSKDPPMSIAAPMELVFVLGYSSGIISVFDIEKSEIIYQCKPFRSSVNNLLFIQNYKLLIAMSGLGNLSIHDKKNNYRQIKVINIEQPAVYTDISLSIETDYFAIIGPQSKCALTWNCISLGMKNNIDISHGVNPTGSRIQKLSLINRNLIALILENCNVRFYVCGCYEGIFLKEIKNLHINNINQFICSQNYQYFITSGEEGMIKIWNMKMIFYNINSYQQFIGHSNSVCGILLLDKNGILISSSKNSGIYFWNFLGNTSFTEGDIAIELSQLEEPSYIKKLKEQSKMLKSPTKRSQSNTYKNTEVNIGKNQLLTKVILSNHMEKKYLAENPVVQKQKAGKINKNLSNLVDDIFGIGKHKKDGNFENEFKVLSSNLLPDENELVNINYSNSDFIIDKEELTVFKEAHQKSENIKNRLLFSSKYSPIMSIKEKENKKNLNETRLNLKHCLGLSVNSMNNLVFNQSKQWYAYSVNNKVIIEYLINEKKEKILQDSNDEISCLVLSPKGDYLISGIGHAYKDEYASIFIYETSTFSLKKKIDYHPKGIQHIVITNNSQYMITIGTKEENSICLWNFIDFSMIDSKSTGNCPFIICCASLKDINEKLVFATASFDALTIWELNMDGELESNDFEFNNIKNTASINNNEENENDDDDDEFITGLNMYEKENETKTQMYLLIGTNKGNVLIIDKDTSSLIKTYLIGEYALTKIFFNGYYFISAGECPFIYIWTIDENNYSQIYDNESNNEDIEKNCNDTTFYFIEKEKPTLLFIDGATNSLVFSESGYECILTTDKGSIFFINIKQKTSIKILSAHINSTLTSINTDVRDVSLVTTGKNDYVRCWSLDLLDQRFLLYKKNHVPDKCLLNEKENIIISQYESSYISIFDIKTFKTLGKIDIPNEDIYHFEFLFNSKSLILMTHQEKIYIIIIQNWEPLCLLFSEIIIPKNNIFFPNDQQCRRIQCSSIDNEKAHVAFSFCDGTISVFFIEKVKEKTVYNLIDKFNLIELHANQYKDENSKELYNNLSSFRSDYNCYSTFSKECRDIVVCFHERMQYIFVRDYMKQNTVRIIDINYLPYSLALNDKGQFVAIGTKEGIIIFVPTGEECFYHSATVKDLYYGHYDLIQALQFTHDSTKLISSSKNEMLVWELQI